jgi:cbb3-type cytochrome oxidase subunit 3
MSKQNTILQPLGTAMILTLGFGVTIFLLVIWGAAIYETAKKAHSAYEEILVLKDGTPIIYT